MPATTVAPTVSEDLAQIKPNPTSAKAWRKQSQEGELLRLPGSGNIARVRRPGLSAMVARAGKVPNQLSEQVVRFHTGEQRDAKNDSDRLELVRQNNAAVIEVAALMLVEPKLVLDREPDYEKGEIAPTDLCDADLIFLYYTVAEGVAEKLAEFRIAE